MKKMKLQPNIYPGKLIAFEGTDGAGKTTMITLTERLLSERFGSEKVLCVKQPTDLSRKTKLFQKMMYCANHDDINYRAVQLLTMSDRLQHSFEVIMPALKAGKFVICDRYVYTSLANMLARGYKKENWFFNAAKHLLKPDAIFLAYVPADMAIKRIKDRPEECNRHLDEILLKNVSKEFLAMSKCEGFIVLDTKKNPVEAFEKVKKVLCEKGII